MLIRPMSAEDLPDAERITDVAFHQVDVDWGGRGEPEPQRRSAEHSRRWIERTAAVLASDPGGCWVAEDGGEVVGVATSIKRDLTWILCSFAVDADRRGSGIGRQLLDAAGRHASGCLRAMLSSTSDPRAVRTYLRAGFTMIPWMYLHGEVRRSALPTRTHVRPGTAADRHLLESLDRRCRDATHGPDHDILMRHAGLVVVDRPNAQGYAYAPDGGGVWIVAATDRRTATELLWEGLAMSPAGSTVSVRHVSPAQTWALDVAVEAGLDVGTSGYLALRGMKEPQCYIPHGALL